MDMINAIHAASSEIVFGDFGMQAISKTNPNHVFGVNSEGWYISQDGGATPKTIATAQGIYADALFAGTLWLTNEMNIEGQTGYLNITGEEFIMRSKTDSNKYFKITPDGALANHGFLSVTRPDSYTDSSGKEWGKWIENGIPQADMDVQRNQFMYPNIISWTGQRYRLNNSSDLGGELNKTYNCETAYTTHKSKFITVGVGVDYRRLEDVGSNRALVEIVDIDTFEVVASLNVLLQANAPVSWHNITFETGVPDFVSRQAYYIRLGSTLASSGVSFVNMIINRVSQHG